MKKLYNKTFEWFRGWYWIRVLGWLFALGGWVVNLFGHAWVGLTITLIVFGIWATISKLIGNKYSTPYLWTFPWEVYWKYPRP